MIKRAVRNFVVAFIAEAGIIAIILTIAAAIDFVRLPQWLATLLLIGAIVIVLVPLLAAIVLPLIPPLWIKQVERSGVTAPALVIRNDVRAGNWSYSGENIFVDIDVRVLPEGGESFNAKMKCHLMSAMILSPGARVMVKYAPEKPKQVLLAITDIRNLMEATRSV